MFTAALTAVFLQFWLLLPLHLPRPPPLPLPSYLPILSDSPLIPRDVQDGVSSSGSRPLHSAVGVDNRDVRLAILKVNKISKEREGGREGKEGRGKREGERVYLTEYLTHLPMPLYVLEPQEAPLPV